MNSPEFNITAWLAGNAYGGANLTPETLRAVAGFTTVWNIFESNLCENRASIAALERLTERYRPEATPNDSKAALEACLAFWQLRYRTSDGFSPRFDALHFRPRDRRDHVEMVLAAEGPHPKDVLLALMIIVYRLRNNLFHGLKDVATLNEQVPNLVTASRCLAAILGALPSKFYAIRDRPTVA